MNPKQTEVADRLYRKIHLAERSFDGGIEAVADLFSDLSNARSRMGAGAEIMQPVLTELAAAMKTITKAKGRLVLAHKQMATGAATMDFEDMFTGEGAKPKPPTGLGDLALVSSAA